MIDRDILAGVVDGLARDEIPLTPEEQEISALLVDERERIPDLAAGLFSYENEGSSAVWSYYFARAVADSVHDPVEKFEALDSVWSDLGYPDSMAQIIYPQQGHPAHLYPALGDRELSSFLATWFACLSQRDPRQRVVAQS
ncbi:hypothetical protein AB0K09_09290 [Streptomyces sp. NPDC049577]|uniref:hypothetical protein n=1 Tax=Streptomyces sp. NPDC049577 TaxID=3155153 RepID=UPI00342158A6